MRKIVPSIRLTHISPVVGSISIPLISLTPSGILQTTFCATGSTAVTMPRRLPAYTIPALSSATIHGACSYPRPISTVQSSLKSGVRESTATNSPSIVLAYTLDPSRLTPRLSRYLWLLLRHSCFPVLRSKAVIYLSGATTKTLSSVTTGTTLPGPNIFAVLPLFQYQRSRPLRRSRHRRLVSHAPKTTSLPSIAGAA